MSRKPIASAVASLFAVSLPALANPVGASVAAGSATVSEAGSTLTVTASDRSIINWQSFNIAAGETTNFVQPSTSSISLNRVTGSSDASSIFGALNANGQLFLINPSGILFGTGSQVDVGGLAVSAVDVGDADFLAGNYPVVSGGSSGPLILQAPLIQSGQQVSLFVPTLAPNGGGSAGSVTVSAGDIALSSPNTTAGAGSVVVASPGGSVIVAGPITTAGSTGGPFNPGTSGCESQSAAACEIALVAAPTLNLTPQQIEPLSALPPLALTAPVPVKAIASHLAPPSLQVAPPPPAVVSPPASATAGLLSLNLQKRDPSF